MLRAVAPADPLRAALFLIAALSLAGLVHSMWLRSQRSKRWMIPLDGGRTVRGRRIFGDNKTVRGFVVMIPASAVSFVLVAVAMGELPATEAFVASNPMLWQLGVGGYLALGALAGLGLMLGELPNSFIKRQLDIAPGAAPRSPTAAAICFITDRLDSIVGMLILVSVAVPTPPAVWGWVLILGPAIHWGFSVLLYRLGVKARAA